MNLEIDLSKYFIQDQLEDVLGDEKYLSTVKKLSDAAYYDISNSCGSINIDVELISSIINNLKFFLNIKKRHLKEIKLLSDYSGSGKELIIGNLIYELTKYGSNQAQFVWCSSAAIWTKYGMVHTRNMDWPLDGLKRGTIELDFHGAPAGSFTAVTFPGFSGILTGIAPDRFSASINMMCEDYGVSFRGKPISFLLREMFEECKDFDDAIEFLERSDSFAPGFIHVVGTEEGENSVVGIMPKQYENFTYEDDGTGLCITNHIPDSDFDDKENEVDSVERLDFLNSEIENVRSMEDAHKIMRKVKNEDTKHTVTMCASTGEYIL